ncbi:hypothetical protein MPP7335_05831 [Mycolicibacterium parafortuitum]|uniref:Uncharacterized protein n=1 Tax=Mycolicibacterium parafortuitum TaxID=39692 RepID=A0A375Z5I6_MYCPF|nr:hypothetical protein BST38_04650 [Mycolicibacterium parafortuitum]SSA20677.1 hypothetical protein MPP7335_05831 [Mycolicibacterium parafortuitum]
MWKLDHPEKVRTISVVGGKVWHVEPGSLEIDGEILRFRLNRAPMTVQVHRSELAAIVSEDDR